MVPEQGNSTHSTTKARLLCLERTLAGNQPASLGHISFPASFPRIPEAPTFCSTIVPEPGHSTQPMDKAGLLSSRGTAVGNQPASLGHISFRFLVLIEVMSGIPTFCFTIVPEPGHSTQLMAK